MGERVRERGAGGVGRRTGVQGLVEQLELVTEREQLALRPRRVWVNAWVRRKRPVLVSMPAASASMRRLHIGSRPDTAATRGFRPPAAIASRPCAARMPASTSPPTTSPPPSSSVASWGSRTCSRRCSCAAGWAIRRRRERFLAAEDAHPLDAFGGPARRRRGDPRPRRAALARSPCTATTTWTAICSTAILVRALRTLGADVDWYLPSRIDDGYGLAAATVERLAARGTDLLVTVDCAITAVAEVAAAKAAGMDVVVTDHHTPRADGALPDAPIVHPRLGGYPCPDLCAAGRRLQARPARCSRRRGRTRPPPTRTSTSSRSPPSPTSSRSRARTAGSCAPACASSRAPASRGCAR